VTALIWGDALRLAPLLQRVSKLHYVFFLEERFATRALFATGIEFCIA
jgi:hypothetical protein